MEILEVASSHLEIDYDGVTLFRYVTHPETAAIESPRPYLHPLRTLQGHLVSGFRPHDHRWHHGLSFTSAYLSGHNFWGGPTFVDGAYKQLDNVGAQRSQSIEVTRHTQQVAEFSQCLTWQSAKGEVVIDEIRTLKAEAFPEKAYWALDWHSHLVPRQALSWGSPTTQGRKDAGYGGLFWRGPRDFEGGQVMLSEGREGQDQMGAKSKWLAYSGRHDEVDAASTLVFIDDSRNPRYPSPWFVRNTTPMVCPNFAFSELLGQGANEALSLRYKILVGDGSWGRARVEEVIQPVP